MSSCDPHYPIRKFPLPSYGRTPVAPVYPFWSKEAFIKRHLPLLMENPLLKYNPWGSTLALRRLHKDWLQTRRYVEFYEYLPEFESIRYCKGTIRPDGVFESKDISCESPMCVSTLRREFDSLPRSWRKEFLPLYSTVEDFPICERRQDQLVGTLMDPLVYFKIPLTLRYFIQQIPPPTQTTHKNVP